MPPAQNSPVLVIEPGLAERHYWRDLWRYRELFYVLAWRDISVRYKQTIIGLAWALIRPFLTMVVFTLVFSRVAKLPSEGTAPYALMVFAGLLPWQFFSTALSESSNSLISNANLISKVYFPRLIVPTAAVVVSFVDFLICFVILVGLFVWYQCDHVFPGQSRTWSLDHRAQREVSRLPLRHSFHRAIWLVHLPSRVQLICYTRRVALAVFTKSSRWSHRWLPLGHSSRCLPDLPARILAELGGHHLLPLAMALSRWSSLTYTIRKTPCQTLRYL
jgi:hypothetical protein